MKILIILSVVEVLIENDNHVDFKNRRNWLYLAVLSVSFFSVYVGIISSFCPQNCPVGWEFYAVVRNPRRGSCLSDLAKITQGWHLIKERFSPESASLRTAHLLHTVQPVTQAHFCVTLEITCSFSIASYVTGSNRSGGYHLRHMHPALFCDVPSRPAVLPCGPSSVKITLGRPH